MNIFNHDCATGEIYEGNNTKPAIEAIGLTVGSVTRLVDQSNVALDLLNALELAEATIERLHRHAPGSANGTLDVIKSAIAKASKL